MDTAKRGLGWSLLRAAAAPAIARPAISTRAVTCALAVIVGLAVSWQVLREPGVVGFVHDWSIAPFAGQHLALLHQTFDGWYRWGLGAPTAYPLEYPLRIVFGIAAGLGADGGAISKALLFCVPAFAFVSATYLARTCRLPVTAAWLCGAFYALDPVMLNKLVSGQAAYLVGYALLPLVPALFLRACERGSTLLGGVALGGVLALAAMEVQIGVLAVALLVVLAVASVRVPAGRRIGVLLCALAVAAVIEAPTFVWAAHGISGLTRLEQFSHGAAWLTANSLAPAAAVRLIGYLALYDVLSIGTWMWLWQPASWGVVAIVVAGLIVLRGPLRATLVVCGALALLIACGTTTPLGPGIAWAFERFPSAQIFRELYHVMALVSLAYAVAVGAAFAFAGRLPGGIALRALIVVAVGIYVAPMLSGDVSGWLAAVPVDRYLAPTYFDENEGAGRVVWFPMDQPLAFDDRGSGVDPMAVTARGSLWLYTPAWPLTAVDDAARRGDTAQLQRELRALGVAAAVERDRLHSRYRTLPRVADFADRYFGAEMRIDPALGTVHDDGTALRVFDVPAPLPIIRSADRFAIVPRRMSAITRASLDGAAAFGYAQTLPRGMPYDAYTDAGDAPWEALQAAGVTRFVERRRVDAFGGFADGDLWWWFRPPYADARRFALAIGHGAIGVTAPRSLHDARLVVAWIATPAGGELEARCGRATTRIDTGASFGSYRSAVVRCGAISAHSAASVSFSGDGAEVALRGLALVDVHRFDEAAARLQALFRGARRVVRVDDAVGRPGNVVRAGRSARIGALTAGTRAMIEVDRTLGGGAAVIRVERRDGFVLAWRRVDRARRTVSVPFIADGSGMRLRSSAGIARWRIRTILTPPSVASAAVRAPRAGRLVVADDAFDSGWRAEGATRHLVSALGTNVFVLPAPTDRPAVRYAYTDEYHVAYGVGTLLLALAVATGVRFSVRVDARRTAA